MQQAAAFGAVTGGLAGLLLATLLGVPYLYADTPLAAAGCGGGVGLVITLAAAAAHKKLLNEPMQQVAGATVACALLGAFTLAALQLVDARAPKPPTAPPVDTLLHWLQLAVLGSVMGGGMGFLINRQRWFAQQTDQLLQQTRVAPQDCATWVALGILAARQAKYPQAVAWLNKARDMNPSPQQQTDIARWLTLAQKKV